MEVFPVKKARQEAGLTQKDLSEWLGIPRRTIEDWDRGASSPLKWVEDLLIEKINREGASYAAEKKGKQYIDNKNI